MIGECRICWENKEVLTKICKCIGSQGGVCIDCLRNQVILSPNLKASICELCGVKRSIEIQIINNNWWYLLKLPRVIYYLLLTENKMKNCFTAFMKMFISYYFLTLFHFGLEILVFNILRGKSLLRICSVLLQHYMLGWRKEFKSLFTVSVITIDLLQVYKALYYYAFFNHIILTNEFIFRYVLITCIQKLIALADKYIKLLCRDVRIKVL